MHKQWSFPQHTPTQDLAKEERHTHTNTEQKVYLQNGARRSYNTESPINFKSAIFRNF